MVQYDPDGVTGPHDHPFEETYFFLEGQAEATFDGKPVRARARATSPGPASAACTPSATSVAVRCAGWRRRRRSPRAGTRTGSLATGTTYGRYSDDPAITAGRRWYAWHRLGDRSPLRRRGLVGRRGRPRRCACQVRGRRVGGDTRGIALDLSEPEQIADALADVDDVDHIVLSAIIRDAQHDRRLRHCRSALPRDHEAGRLHRGGQRAA